jgi:hypothetical protein
LDKQKLVSAGHILDHLHPTTQIAMEYLFEDARQKENIRIIKILESNCEVYHTALMGCECSIQIQLIKEVPIEEV